MVNTRNQPTRDQDRRRKTTPPGAINARKIKRRHEDNSNEQRPGTSTNRLDQLNTAGQQPDQGTATEGGLDLAEINVHNYGSQKQYWPTPRILEQLARQKSTNQSQPNPLIVAEALALHDSFQHSLHMLAMIGKVTLDTLKVPLGLNGASRSTNDWHRFLSFSNLAYTLPMPHRGDLDSSEVLSARNRANKAAYDSLTDDQVAIFDARIFYALGGYPDYSAINVDGHQDAGDCEVLIPEVPKLSQREEELYRPLYDEIVDKSKVAKHRARFQPPSAQTKEKRSLQLFKKRMQELHHDSCRADFDYYVMGCSKNLGTGWCEEVTSRPEISTWLADKCKFQTLFTMYSQGGPDIAEINSAAEKNGDGGKPKSTRVPNKSDKESTELTECLRKELVRVLGVNHPKLPIRGFPRGPDLPAQFKKLDIPVKIVRDLESAAMTQDEFDLGFDRMKAAGRRHWLQDIKDGKFTLVLKDPSQADDVTDVGGGTGGGSVGNQSGGDKDASDDGGGEDDGNGGSGDGESSGCT